MGNMSMKDHTLPHHFKPEKIFVKEDIFGADSDRMVKYEKHETMGFFENPG